jgi:hypothetical protein
MTMMNESGSDIEQIEMSIQEAQRTIDLGKSLDRLNTNKDFIKIFLEGYLEKEAIRLVHLKSDPAMSTPEMQADVIRSIDSIGITRSYLITIMQKATMAERAVNDYHEELKVALTEDSE